MVLCHDDVIKWKHFPRYWPFLRGIHRSPVNSTHKGQWRGALMFSLICTWINGWVNNSEAGDLRRHRTHDCITIMWSVISHANWHGRKPNCYSDGISYIGWVTFEKWQKRQLISHLTGNLVNNTLKWAVCHRKHQGTRLSTHLGRDKMAAISRPQFQMHFLEGKCMNCD